jgi:hypothetical protein
MGNKFILICAAVFCLIPLGLLIAWEFIYLKRFKGRTIPSGIALVIYIAEICLVCGSLWLGSSVAREFLSSARLSILRFGVGLGMLTSGYVVSIFLQLGQNMVRLSLGMSQRPIQWVRKLRL